MLSKFQLHPTVQNSLSNLIKGLRLKRFWFIRLGLQSRPLSKHHKASPKNLNLHGAELKRSYETECLCKPKQSLLWSTRPAGIASSFWVLSMPPKEKQSHLSVIATRTGPATVIETNDKASKIAYRLRFLAETLPVKMKEFCFWSSYDKANIRWKGLNSWKGQEVKLSGHCSCIRLKGRGWCTLSGKKNAGDLQRPS